MSSPQANVESIEARAGKEKEEREVLVWGAKGPNALSKRHQKVGVGALTGHRKVMRLVWLGSVRVRTEKPFSVEFFICFSVCKTFIFGVTGFTPFLVLQVNAKISSL